MPIEENVVKMPDPLERRAQRIDAAFKRRDKSDDDWIGATLEIAVEFAGARAEVNDKEFGDWCKRYDNRVSSHERAILVKWGNDLKRARTALNAAGETRSIRTIHKNGWESDTDVKPHPPGGLQRDKARSYVQAYEAEHQRLPPETIVARDTGISRGTAADYLRDVKSRRADEDNRITFTKAQDHHVQARLRILAKQLETEFAERVRLAVLEQSADYRATLERLQREASEKWERYDNLINNHKPIFNDTEFTTILTCLHPDNSASAEKRNTAFRSFNAVKFQLTGKK